MTDARPQKQRNRAVTIVAAICNNNAIGQDGDLICRLKPDMKHFRQLTMGHTLLMGRKTRDSLAAALPGRRNIVLSHDPDYHPADTEVFENLHDVLAAVPATDDIMVIGGGQIYTLTLPLATRLVITQINVNAPGADTFFPEIDPAQWINTTPDQPWITDPETQIQYRIICLIRK